MLWLLSSQYCDCGSKGLVLHDAKARITGHYRLAVLRQKGLVFLA